MIRWSHSWLNAGKTRDYGVLATCWITHHGITSTKVTAVFFFTMKCTLLSLQTALQGAGNTHALLTPSEEGSHLQKLACMSMHLFQKYNHSTHGNQLVHLHLPCWILPILATQPTAPVTQSRCTSQHSTPAARASRAAPTPPTAHDTHYCFAACRPSTWEVVVGRGVLLRVLRAHCRLLSRQALLVLLVRGVQAGLTVKCAPSLPGPLPTPASTTSIQCDPAQHKRLQQQSDPVELASQTAG